ncbi:Uncharacterised protein [Mycobacteroides abscessus subsp. abscessus]|nr:Uncharacterised protein [Mycobacteroides abscessus subsp. abscessus]
MIRSVIAAKFLIVRSSPRCFMVPLLMICSFHSPFVIKKCPVKKPSVL